MKIKLESELAYCLYNNEPDDCYKFITVQYYGEWRWGSNYRLIIQDLATKKFFAAICQVQSGDHYYHSFEQSGSPIEFTEVEPFQITVTKYREVSDD